MGKFLVRITTILVAIYFLVCYMLAQFCGIDILSYTYTLLFELIVVVYSFSEGKYHCRYLKFTLISIFIADVITRLDYFFDFLSISAHNLIPIAILAIGISISTFQAINHFIKVRRLKNGNTK